MAWINIFEEMLTGGHHNSLGKTEEVAAEVLDKPSLIDNLFACYKSGDDVVRLRVSSAFKRIAKVEPGLILPLVDQFLELSSTLHQPSLRWTFAQIMTLPGVESGLSSKQKSAVIKQLKNSLVDSTDWIVLNITAEVLTSRALADKPLREWLTPNLERLTNDPRKSVAARAKKHLHRLKSLS